LVSVAAGLDLYRILAVDDCLSVSTTSRAASTADLATKKEIESSEAMYKTKLWTSSDGGFVRSQYRKPKTPLAIRQNIVSSDRVT
jgi:hypothetical protein